MRHEVRLVSSFSALATLVTTVVAACGGGGGAGTGGSAGSGGGGPCVEPAANSAFCEDETLSEPNCDNLSAAFKHEVCGVALKSPLGGDLARSTDVEKYAGTGPVNLSCFEEGSFPPGPGMSAVAKMEGIAEIFSNGCESNGVRIEVFEVKRTGGADEADLGALVGTEVLTAADCTAAGAGLVSDVEDCPDMRYECYYSYDGVPTETELVIRTSSAPDAATKKWGTVYEYNVFVRNEEVVDGVWAHDVRALAQEDYGVIAAAAIGGPVTPGNGAIAGEIHDCDDVRLTHAVAAIDKPSAIVTYFTNNEDNPLPDTTTPDSSVLSLYSAIDVSPGPVTIAAGGFVDGVFTTAGFFRARVFADSVTAVTFRGLSPVYVP